MVCFDFGGTLWGENFNPLPGYLAILPYLSENAKSIQPLALALRANALFHALHERSELEIPQTQFLQLFLASEGIELQPGLDLEELVYRFWSAAEPTILKDGIAQTLQALRSRGIRIAVISNTSISGNVMQRRLDESLPGNGFAFVLTSCDYLYRKPAAELFRVAEKKAGLPPEELVYCGNSFSADVCGAAGAGWLPVWYNETGAAPPEDTACKYKEISHWKDLLAALQI